VCVCVCTDCGLYIVGSSLNGFGSSMSDMDLCLMVSHLEVSCNLKQNSTICLSYVCVKLPVMLLVLSE